MRDVDSKKDMVHACVANNHNLVDLFRIDLCFFAALADVLIDLIENFRSKGCEFLLIKLRVCNSRHEIAAIDRLRVHTPSRCELLSSLEV